MALRSIQVIPNGLPTLLTTSASIPLGGNFGLAPTNYKQIVQIVPADFELLGFYGHLAVHPVGAADKHTLTIYKNNVATAATLEWSQSESGAKTWTGSVSFDAGDLVHIDHVNTDAARASDVRYSTRWRSKSGANQSWYGGSSYLDVHRDRNEYAAIYGGFDSGPGITEENRYWLAPCAGTLKNLYVELDATLFAADEGHTYAIRKNDVTTSLQVETGPGATKKSDLTNTVSVAAGDRISLLIDPTGPGFSVEALAWWGVLFEATNDGEFVLPSSRHFNLSTTLALYHACCGENRDTGGSTSVDPRAHAMDLKAIYAWLNGSPGTSKSYKFTAYKNGSAQTALECTISGGATTCNDTGTVTVAEGDLASYFLVTPSGSPTARKAAVSFLGYVAPEDVVEDTGNPPWFGANF